MVTIDVVLITNLKLTFKKLVSRVPCIGECVEFDGCLDVYKVINVTHKLSPPSIHTPVAQIVVEYLEP